VQITSAGPLWWIRDLDTAAGTFVDGARVQLVPLRDEVRLGLGPDGPVLRVGLVDLEAEGAAPGPAPSGAARPASSPSQAGPARPPPASRAELVRRIEGADGAAAGPQTLMLRAVVSDVKRRAARRYQLAVGLLVVALAGAGAFGWWQHRKLEQLRTTAESLYYGARELDLQTVRLEELVARGAEPRLVAEVAARRARLRRMEAEYDAFVQELGVYAKLAKDEQLILRIARRFGECDANVPPGFASEVRRYIRRWGETARLARGLQRARDHGYAAAITAALEANGLPRQFLYLPLQESNYDDRAIGPPTHYGHAKGMWQFISPTGDRYGLKIGPRWQEPVFDPQDERFDWRKATGAAVRYIHDLTVGDAQGSGLLVMASYNWGETHVRKLITQLPENPRERNFWRLLRDRRVPAETYDYVMSIFSAAVICEDPALFGMDVACPEPERRPAG
jgi:pSer/pThr/pTyr-binding forkhead associated (FHA) protein